MKLAYIGGFGLLGVFARYLLGPLAMKYFTPSFPFGTFLINIAGCFLIGVVYVLGVERAIVSPDVRVGLMVGFLGGFTTFSSYSLEATQLIAEAEYFYAALYFCLSPILGLIATFCGLFFARIILRCLA